MDSTLLSILMKLKYFLNTVLIAGLVFWHLGLIYTRFSGKYLLIRNSFSVGIHLFKVSDGNTRTNCEIWFKLTMKTPTWLKWRHSGVYIIKFNRFHTLLWCFYCFLWTSKCWLSCNHWPGTPKLKVRKTYIWTS